MLVEIFVSFGYLFDSKKLLRSLQSVINRAHEKSPDFGPINEVTSMLALPPSDRVFGSTTLRQFN